VKNEDLSDQEYKPSAEYTKRLSLQWRVAASKKVISYLIKNKFYDGSKIVAWGFSEGGQVVPHLALHDKRITHVVAVVGSGLNQLYDGIVETRIQAATGQITHQQAQEKIEQDFRNLKEIYGNRNDTEKEVGGHSFQRWASFASEIPFESYRRLSIPIYLVASSADKSSPIFGLDYVPLEFIRLGKNNLTYDVCVGCDHLLNQKTIVEGKEEIKNLGDQFTDKILRWIEANSGRK
jgi:pimeloyl-ACP methyl ester carboxylesterase